MLDQIIRLDTPAGRALYRLINTLVPQSIVGSIFYGLEQASAVPVDTDITIVLSVFVGGLITAADKLRRDVNESNKGTGELRSGTDEQLHFNPNR